MNKIETAYQGVHAVVLGASGFIGRWVARYLTEMGAEIELIVRDRDEAERIFSVYRVRGRMHNLDLLDFKAVRAQLHEIKPTIIFNLAGYGIDQSEREPKIFDQINTQFVGLLCEVMANIKDKSWVGQDIIHIGSALEYGFARGDLSEDTIPDPTTMYGRSKLEGTRVLAKSCKTYQLKGLTARLFTVYGPGEHPGRLFPSLLNIARTGDDLPLTAGHQKRDFTYVADIAEGLLLLGITNSGSYRIVNVATGVLTSVKDFVLTAAQLMGIKSHQLNFGVLPTRGEEMDHKPVSIKRLNELTGWLPRTTVAEGIRKTIDFETKH